ncbi:hypothetical protein EEQ99_09805 [Rhizobium anhuiense]|uniref:Uncharacterized protein n=1 Tax=Rhizobium anhuiense TaxID=1184720 RepID=A0A3S0QGK3_9HYPH|nr:hypothetical protein EEQ99_09805 [Rhizobium anhuiense]
MSLFGKRHHDAQVILLNRRVSAVGEDFRVRVLTIFGILVGALSTAAIAVLTQPFEVAPIAKWLFILVGAPALALLIHMGVGKLYFSAKGEGPFGPPRPKSRIPKYHEPKRIFPWVPYTNLFTVFMTFCVLLMSGIR